MFAVAPSLTLPYQVITQKAGRDTLLECVVTSNPPANAHWHKGGTILQVRVYVDRSGL